MANYSTLMGTGAAPSGRVAAPGTRPYSTLMQQASPPPANPSANPSDDYWRYLDEFNQSNAPTYPRTQPSFYPYTTAEPEDAFAQNRISAGQWGNEMDATLAGAANQYGGLEQGYRNWGLGGPGGYADILSGKDTGYSPEEMQNMLQQGTIGGGMARPDELGQFYLSQGEQAAQLGSPYEARDTFTSGLPGVGGYVDAAKWDTRGAVGEMAQDYRGAIDPAKLGLSGEFNQDFAFTDADAQAIKDAAGRTVGVRSQAERDALERSAAAQGQTTPLGLASAMERNAYGSNIAAADASNQAAIRAKQLGLDVTRGREQMRLGTEQDISGRLMNAAGNVGTARLQNEQNLGQQGIDYSKWGLTGTTAAQQYGEAESAARNAQLSATNRANLSNMLGTKYSQGLGAGQYYGGVYGNQAMQRQKLGMEGRGYITDAEKRAQEGRIVSTQQRIGAAGTQFPATHQATAGQLTAKATPSQAMKILFGI